MKALTGTARGSAGAVTVTGAAVGDTVSAVFAVRRGGEIVPVPSGSYETVVTVADQVQQVTPLKTTLDATGASPLFTNPDGTTSATPTAGLKELVNATMVFILAPSAAASADGAVTAKEGTIVVTKAGVCAMTIADPTATTDDFRELTFISATAQAHTLSNAAGSGFNAGGASKDVATFGGAIGDGLTLVAYQGKWLVKRSTNITLG